MSTDSLHTRHLKSDKVKLSIPFSYMALTANSMDSAPHAVQVYSDITGGMCNCSPKPVFSPQLGYCYALALVSTTLRYRLFVFL